MKKSLLCLLIFFFLFSYGQSQKNNTTVISAPKEYKMIGDLTWSKGENIFKVLKIDISVDTKEALKNISSELKFIKEDEFKINDKKYKTDFYLVKNTNQLIGVMTITKDGYSYIFTAKISGNEFSGTEKEKLIGVIGEIYYLMSYSAVKLN